MSAKARKIEGARQREGAGITETMDSQVEERMLRGGRGRKVKAGGGMEEKPSEGRGPKLRVCEKANTEAFSFISLLKQCIIRTCLVQKCSPWVDDSPSISHGLLRDNPIARCDGYSLLSA